MDINREIDALGANVRDEMVLTGAQLRLGKTKHMQAVMKPKRRERRSAQLGGQETAVRERGA